MTLVAVLQGPVNQSTVSLTTSFRHQLVKYMPTTYANTPLIFVEKMGESFDFHIFSNKKITVYFDNVVGIKILTLFQQNITVYFDNVVGMYLTR